MELPIDLQRRIVAFLKSLPNISRPNERQALILSAGLDFDLQSQLTFDGTTTQFAQLLLSTLIEYGTLSDGRNALEAILDAAKDNVGQNKQAYCDSLIKELRILFVADSNAEENLLELSHFEKTAPIHKTPLWEVYNREPECGIAPREKVFSLEEDLSGQVFNIELLTNPIVIKKYGRRTYITIDRDDVHWGLYSLAGREKIHSFTFPDSKAKAEALQYDMDIHRFLLEGQKGKSFHICQPNLRWASGGVLSIVDFRERQWVPFFFRDMPPYGWQICQGASEKKDDDLNNPWSFIMREFLEEMLVCHDAAYIVRHPFVFGDFISVDQQTERAKKLSRKHDKLRSQRDGIQFVQGEPIVTNIVTTTMQLQIRHKNTMQPHAIPGFLVLFNIAELGIEVIKIIRYELGDNDYILSGEIYDPCGRDQAELVREPVALISLDYLRQAFENKIEYKFSYEFDKNLPSVMAPDIPPNDIHIFSSDAERRYKIASGDNVRPSPTEWEKDLYSGWYTAFGKYFYDTSNNVAGDNACPLFTPTAAKALTYYFAYHE